MKEKKVKILETIIQEEIDLLVEEVQSHGLARFTDRGTFTGMLLSPLIDIKDAILHGGSKAAVQLASMAAFLVSSTIASLLPFNDPQTVNFLAQKFKYWEQENLKLIDKQFEKELGQMRDGWETFKTDFWGIGFIASPMSAIAAIATADKGIDMGLSILNTVTAGQSGKLIDKINADVTDPGSLRNFLGKKQEEDKRKEQERIEKAVESDRCIARLEDPNYIDPKCIGLDSRDMFPSNASGTQQYIDFVIRNIQNYNDRRQKEFETRFPDKEFIGAFWKKSNGGYWRERPERETVVPWLKSHGFLSESQLNEGFFQNLANKITGQKTPRKKTNVPSIENLHKKVDEWVAQGKIKPTEAVDFYKQVSSEVINDPSLKAAANEWSVRNVNSLVGNMFGKVNDDISKLQTVKPEEIQAYKQKIPEMIDEIFKKTSETSKKFKPVISPTIIQIAKNAATKMSAALNPTAVANQAKVQTPQAIQPQQVKPVSPQQAPVPQVNPAAPATVPSQPVKQKQ